MTKFRLGSAFSGIGAWEKALTRLNIEYELKWFFEIDKYAIKSYCAIHNVDEKLNKGDITKANPKELEDIDVFVYSPPCQSYSVAGKRLGLDDPRGVLFYDALKIIREKKPKYALMENVKGLTTGKFKNIFDDMLAELDYAGYNNYWKILNSKDFGIPQNRERVFVVSIRKDIKQHFEFPKGSNVSAVLKDILEYKGCCHGTLLSRSTSSKCKVILEPDAELPILHNIYGGFKEKKPRIFTKYSPTIRTSAGGGHIPSVCTTDKDKIEKEIAGYKIRKLTPLECWRLMGFDDNDFYKAKQALINTYYNGKDRADTQLYKQAGNSIVVNVLEEIYKTLFKDYIR